MQFSKRYEPLPFPKYDANILYCTQIVNPILVCKAKTLHKQK